MRDIMPRVRYYSYIEIATRAHQTLWHEYESVADRYPTSRWNMFARLRTSIRCSGSCSRSKRLEGSHMVETAKNSAAGRWA